MSDVGQIAGKRDRVLDEPNWASSGRQFLSSLI